MKVCRMATDPFPRYEAEPAGSMVATFNAADLPTVGQQDAFVYWTQLPKTAGVPSIEHIDPLALPRSALTMMAVLEVVEQDFLVRLAGTALTDMLGKEFTGTKISDLPDADDGTERLFWAVRHRRPYYSRSTLTWAPKSFRRYGVLTLPFGDEGPVSRLLLIFDFEKTLS